MQNIEFRNFSRSFDKFFTENSIFEEIGCIGM